jgi:hypothetical protein
MLRLRVRPRHELAVARHDATAINLSDIASRPAEDPITGTSLAAMRSLLAPARTRSGPARPSIRWFPPRPRITSFRREPVRRFPRALPRTHWCVKRRSCVPSTSTTRISPGPSSIPPPGEYALAALEHLEIASHLDEFDTLRDLRSQSEYKAVSVDSEVVREAFEHATAIVDAITRGL